VVVQGTNHPLLFTQNLSAQQAHWINEKPAVEQSFRCMAKNRYRQDDQACVVNVLTTGDLNVIFDAPQRAITPGQSVVFYQQDLCLGGAVISATW
jgi:tRNA-uridine 2-sulfurtransferase